MLYTKYVIQVIINEEVVKDIIIQNNNNYNSYGFEIRKNPTYVVSYKYLDNYGTLLTTPHKFYTYKQAMYYLDKYYNTILGVNQFYPPIVSIVETLDNIVPPLLILRQLKINKILKNKK